MEGFVVADGGRVLRSGLLAFGTVIWSAPLLAQAASDPVSPLSAAPQPVAPIPTTQQAPAPTSQPATSVTQPAAPLQTATPLKPVVVPKDWRGVFDAIDAGSWASAQAGIAALPRSILTPVAKAELYTAKGSPVVDLGSLQALLAEAPEIPQADQLAIMAWRRGATTPPMIIPERATMNLGSAPVRYKTRPVTGEPGADELRAILDPLI